MRYEVDDIVVIRRDLVARQWYGNDIFTSDMNSLRGKVAVVKTINGDGKYYLSVKGKLKNFHFTDEMLENTRCKNDIIKLAVELSKGIQL